MTNNADDNVAPAAASLADVTASADDVDDHNHDDDDGSGGVATVSLFWRKVIDTFSSKIIPHFSRRRANSDSFY